MKKEEKKKIQLIYLILANTNMLDFAGISHVFLEAQEHGLDAELKFCSYEDKIETAFKMPLGKLNNYKKYKAGEGDFLFIVSANYKYIFSDKLNPPADLLNWINEAYDAGATVCSICTGAFLLGKTGLLDNKKCTTHWNRTSDLQKQFPFALVQENILFIEDQRIITSAGAGSGIDVALYILGKIMSEHYLYKISRDLVIYNRRSGGQEQQSAYLSHRNHMHTGIHKVQDWILENLSKKMNIADLAEIAAMSERNFTRVFRKETLLSVNDYITLIRKEKIKQLLKNPDISRAQIAKHCGLKSERQVSRLMTSNN